MNDVETLLIHIDDLILKQVMDIIETTGPLAQYWNVAFVGRDVDPSTRYRTHRFIANLKGTNKKFDVACNISAKEIPLTAVLKAPAIS